MRRARPTPHHHPTARAGFTLLETMLAVTIIGVGVVAIVYAQRHFLEQNLWSAHAATATYLGNEIRERVRDMPRHDAYSGGLYFVDPDNPDTLAGWGPEAGEAEPSDFDDIDDFSNVVLGDATDLPEWLVEEGFTRFAGPMDAFGSVIPQTDWDGTVRTIEVDGEVIEVSMEGWTQIVRVQKVDPADFSTVVPIEETVKDAGGNVVREVDDYPLRVTVLLLYEGIYEDEAPPVTSVSWVVHP